MINVLILGSSGLLGKQLYQKLKYEKNLKLYHNGIVKKKLDLSKKNQLRKIIYNSKPNLVINCTGLTNLEKCENFSSISKKINVDILDNIFDIKKKNNLKFKFIHFSTDNFYNKKKNKKSNEKSKIYMMNKYCIHKRMAEKICLRNKSLIFRTNFFGKSNTKNKSFSDWVYYSFRKNFFFYLFDDVCFNPLRIKTITKIITIIINKKMYCYSGIYNLGSKNGIYKNNFAIYFAKKLKIYKKNYINISVNKLLNVRRSNNMLMNIKKFQNKFKIELPKIETEITNECKENYNK